MIQINYVVNGKDYLDTRMVRNELKITKSQFQYMEKNNPFPESEILLYQNKKLYSIEGLKTYLEKLMKYEELKEKLKWQ